MDTFSKYNLAKIGKTRKKNCSYYQYLFASMYIFRRTAGTGVGGSRIAPEMSKPDGNLLIACRFGAEIVSKGDAAGFSR